MPTIRIMPFDGQRPRDPTRVRADMRERALARLSRLTTAAAIGGTFATVGFGGLAAVTYSGSPTPTDPISVDDSAPQGQVQGTQPNGTNPSATRAPTTGQQVAPAQPPTVTTRRRTHVSSGGSG